MATLPQLIEEDVHQLEELLRELLSKTDATTALVIDKGGFLICTQGDARQFDVTTIAALASGAFMANQTIATMVHETSFNSVYQQGENFSMYVHGIDEHCLLVVIFRAGVSVGLIKYFAGPCTSRIAEQMAIARDRDPANGLDLSVLNMADTRDLFKRRDQG
jgi:predicted regulator of Ras-like GTPase activity (Roadblock/LC7/MglB family)